MTAAQVEHLAELLTHYAIFHGKPLYVTIRPGVDSWELVHRPGLNSLGADWCAVKARDGQVWVITDAEVFRDLANIAREIPTVAPEFVRMWAHDWGADAFELSPGWSAGVRRLAAMMPAGG